MKTVLFLSLFVIGNVFGEKGCEVSQGSPRLSKTKFKVKSAEMCAYNCNLVNKCLIWKYNEKRKKCIFTLLKVKKNKKTSFGVNCLLGGEVFEGSQRLKAKKVKKIKSAELCSDACESRDNCVLWKYNKKNKKCKINVFNVKPNPKVTFGFPSIAPPPTTTLPESLPPTTPPPTTTLPESLPPTTPPPTTLPPTTPPPTTPPPTTLPPTTPPPTTLPPTTLAPEICPEGWDHFNHTGSCYRAFPYWNTWFEARENCTNYGGDLVSIHDDIELDFVNDMLDAGSFSYVWLGGKFNNQTGIEKWEWSDGSSFNFRNIPDPVDDHTCLEVWLGEWSGFDCNGEQPWVCKI